MSHQSSSAEVRAEAQQVPEPPEGESSRTTSLRLDVLTVFPDYLRVLDLSLIGRATQDGLIDLNVHDLRDWARDRHRTVDDTPLGGGAGMVMKPDVWGQALDEVLDLPADPAQARALSATRGRDQVLVVPTPSGRVFTQRDAERLVRADQVVFACGRYEGIDNRVAAHYARCGVEVMELSIGDYVLNGGEVASLVMIEATARLLPGVLGNPESVVEESHSLEGLLEHETYTRPVSWRGLDLARSAPVLLSGDHDRVARFRRDDALARTARRRPDMIERLDPARLDAADRAALACSGWVVPQGAPNPLRTTVRAAVQTDLPALATLAARTFPDACPSFLSPEEVAVHVRTSLSPERLGQWLADPRVVVTVAELGQGLPGGLPAGLTPGELVGYSVVITEVADQDGGLPVGLDKRPGSVLVSEHGDRPGLAAELSKVYTDARLRGSGLASALLSRAVDDAAAAGVTALWLGTHERNKRAQKAYRRADFAKVGTRVYEVGGHPCRDVVMVRDLQEQV